MVPENLNPKGLEHSDVLDAFAYDARRATLVLAMFETRLWDGGERQLFQLQEKLNAYASFILDGEMAGAFPQHVGRPVEIQLRTRHEPSDIALRLLAQAREQLALQEIALVTILLDSGHHPHGGGCGCCDAD